MSSSEQQNVNIATTKKWLCNALRITLLALCVVMIVFWIRGYYAHDALWCQARKGGPLIGVVSVLASTSLIIHERYGWRPGVYWRSTEETGTVQQMIHRTSREPNWEFCGFGFAHSYAWRTWVLTVPDWLVIVLAGAWPLKWTLHKRRVARRDKSGLCPACGYDLRASPQRCPECGKQR